MALASASSSLAQPEIGAGDSTNNKPNGSGDNLKDHHDSGVDLKHDQVKRKSNKSKKKRSKQALPPAKNGDLTTIHEISTETRVVEVETTAVPPVPELSLNSTAGSTTLMENLNLSKLSEDELLKKRQEIAEMILFADLECLKFTKKNRNFLISSLLEQQQEDLHDAQKRNKRLEEVVSALWESVLAGRITPKECVKFVNDAIKKLNEKMKGCGKRLRSLFLDLCNRVIREDLVDLDSSTIPDIYMLDIQVVAEVFSMNSSLLRLITKDIIDFIDKSLSKMQSGNNDGDSTLTCCRRLFMLLSICGHQLESALSFVEKKASSAKKKAEIKETSKGKYMDKLFENLNSLSNDSSLSTRVRQCLSMLIKLRKDDWKSKDEHMFGFTNTSLELTDATASEFSFNSALPTEDLYPDFPEVVEAVADADVAEPTNETFEHFLQGVRASSSTCVFDTSEVKPETGAGDEEEKIISPKKKPRAPAQISTKFETEDSTDSILDDEEEKIISPRKKPRALALKYTKVETEDSPDGILHNDEEKLSSPKQKLLAPLLPFTEKNETKDNSNSVLDGDEEKNLSVQQKPPTPALQSTQKVERDERPEGTFDVNVEGKADAGTSAAKDIEPETVQSIETVPVTQVSETQQVILTLQNKCESYFNWLKNEITMDEAINLETIIQVKFLDKAAAEEEGLRYNGIKKISEKGVIVYLQILSNQLDKAKNTLEEVKRYVIVCTENGYIGKGYISGCSYVIACLDVYLTAEKLKAESSQLELAEEEVEKLLLAIWKKPLDFDGLCNEAKACVLAMRQYVEKLMYNNYDEQIALLNKVIELDDKNCEWLVCKLYHLRLKRREFKYENPGSKPKFFEEVEVLAKAMQLGPTHPNCRLALCQVIADIASLKKNGNASLTCGDLKFETLEDAVKFLKTELKNILEVLPHSGKAYLTSALIFSNILPDKYLDYDFAKQCIKRTLEYYPKCSKANHRMAQYFLKVDHSTVSAEKYCTIAYNTDKRNKPAYFELIQILLSNPIKNTTKLQNHFEWGTSHEYNSKWNVDDTARVKYFKSLYLLMTQKDQFEGIQQMVEAEKLHADSCILRNLGYHIKKYNWSSELISYGKIISALTRIIERKTSSTAIIAVPGNIEILGTLRRRAQAGKSSDQRRDSKQAKRLAEDERNAPPQASKTNTYSLAPCVDIRHVKSNK